MMKLKAAIAQVDCRVGVVEQNLAHHLESIERAIEEKTQLVLFPELSLTGYTLRDLAWDVAIHPHRNKVLAPLIEKSKKISIVVGFVESGKNHGIYNSAMFLEDGEIKSIHRKVYPPTYGMFEEGRYFSAGKSVTAFDSKHGRFGMLICEDLWHISMPYMLALDGAEALLCLTASPTRLSGEGSQLDNQVVNYEHHRTFARLLNVYILFSNRVGFEDGVNFWGGSHITAPSGEMISVAKLQEEAFITADLDSNEVQRARRFSRHFLDERPEIVRDTLRYQLKRK
jgi:NAD+ synthase (glutamine-hydrolysing)